MTFGRHAEVMTKWLSNKPFRQDISPELQAEGVQAFAIQAISLMFCSLHNAVTVRDRLETYLDAWLLPSAAGKAT
jgi:hypothetical protein